MSAWRLAIELEQGDRAVRAGEPVRGWVVASTDGDGACRRLGIRWNTTVGGGATALDFDPARRVAHEDTLHEGALLPGVEHRLPFAFDAPLEPLTYAGRQISVAHALEAFVDLERARDTEVSESVDLVPGRTPSLPMRGAVDAVRERSETKRFRWRRLGLGAVLFAVFWVLKDIEFLGSAALLGGIVSTALGWGSSPSRRRLGAVELHLDSGLLSPGELVPVRVVMEPDKYAGVRTARVKLRGREVRATSHTSRRAKDVEHVVHEEESDLNGPVAVDGGGTGWEGSVQVPRTRAWTVSASRFRVSWTISVELTGTRGGRCVIEREMVLAPRPSRWGLAGEGDGAAGDPVVDTEPQAALVPVPAGTPSPAAFPVSPDQWAELSPKPKRRGHWRIIQFSVIGAVVLALGWLMESGAGTAERTEDSGSPADLLMVQVDGKGVGLATTRGLFLSEYPRDAEEPDDARPRETWSELRSALETFHDALQAELTRGVAEGFPPAAQETRIAGLRPPRNPDSNVASWCWQPSPSDAGLIGCYALYGPGGVAWPFDEREGQVVDARWLNDTTAVVVHDLPPGADWEEYYGEAMAGVTVATVSGSVLWQSGYIISTNESYSPVVNGYDWPDGIAVSDGFEGLFLLHADRPDVVDEMRVGGASHGALSEVSVPGETFIRFTQRDSARSFWVNPDGNQFSGGHATFVRWERVENGDVEFRPESRTDRLIVGPDTFTVSVTANDRALPPFLSERWDGIVSARLLAGHTYDVVVTGAEGLRREFNMTRESLVEAGVRLWDLAESGRATWDGPSAGTPEPSHYYAESGRMVFEGMGVSTWVEVFAVYPDGRLFASDWFAQTYRQHCPQSATPSADGRYVLGCGGLWDLAAGEIAFGDSESSGIAARWLGRDKVFSLTDGDPPADNAFVYGTDGGLVSSFRFDGYMKGGEIVLAYPHHDGDRIAFVDQRPCQAPTQVFVLLADGSRVGMDLVPVAAWPPPPSASVPESDALWELRYDADVLFDFRYVAGCDAAASTVYVDEQGRRAFVVAWKAEGSPSP